MVDALGVHQLVGMWSNYYLEINSRPTTRDECLDEAAVAEATNDRNDRPIETDTTLFVALVFRVCGWSANQMRGATHTIDDACRRRRRQHNRDARERAQQLPLCWHTRQICTAGWL